MLGTGGDTCLACPLQTNTTHTIFHHAQNIAGFRSLAREQLGSMAYDRVHHEDQRHASGEVYQPVAMQVRHDMSDEVFDGGEVRE